MSDQERGRIAEVVGKHVWMWTWNEGSTIAGRDTCSCGYDEATSDMDYNAHVAADLLPLIREAEARAWDEGHEAGAHNVAAADDRDASFQDNPYREGVRRAGQ